MPTRASRSNRFGNFAVAVLLVPLSAGTTAAAPAGERKAELQEQQSDVKGRIAALRRELADSEESRNAAADQLQETEAAISNTGRRLRRLSEERGAVEAQVEELADRTKQLRHQTADQQARLGRLLHRQYTRNDGAALQWLFSGQEPNQAAFDRYMLSILARNTAGLIADLKHSTRESKLLTEASQKKALELAEIEQKQQQTRQLLVDQQRQHQALLTKLTTKIREQRRTIGELQRDEKRLARLIEGLAKINRKPTKPKIPDSVPPTPATPTGSPGRSERLPDPGLAAGRFAALKGHLNLPVRGEIANRFGTPRPEGGTTWKGLFLRSPEGSDVHAIAPGQVVFADWLRGFGNLLIIDHGDDFLSVYGNNQSLLRETGDSVKAGEVIATVGATGGAQQSGLYFELRHQGQAFDPLRWVSLR